MEPEGLCQEHGIEGRVLGTDPAGQFQGLRVSLSAGEIQNHRLDIQLRHAAFGPLGNLDGSRLPEKGLHGGSAPRRDPLVILQGQYCVQVRQIPELLPEAVCDAARLDDIMRFYSGRDAQ